MAASCGGNCDAGFGPEPRITLNQALATIESAIAHVRREGYKVEARDYGLHVLTPNGQDGAGVVL